MLSLCWKRPSGTFCLTTCVSHKKWNVMRVRKRWHNAHFEVNCSFISLSLWSHGNLPRLTWLLWSTADFTHIPNLWIDHPTSQIRELNNLSNNGDTFTWGQNIQRKKHFLSHLMQFLSVLLKPLKRSSLQMNVSFKVQMHSTLIKENEWFYCVHEKWHEDTEAQHQRCI